MLMALKSLLHTLLLPPGGPLLLAIAGAWLVIRHGAGRARRGGIALLCIGLVSLWLLATPLVAGVLARAAERCPALDLSHPVQAQAIVVLGGEGKRPTAPEYAGEPAAEQRMLERLTYAVYVARRTGLPIAVSGTQAEASAMRASLARDFGMATHWAEDRSRDTFENAEFSAALLRPLGIDRIVLVTDADHEWRAVQEFTSAGFTVVPAPVGLDVPSEIELRSFIPSPSALLHSSAALYELLGDLARRTFAALHLRRHGR
jgi:uncharacterized SAM-binding protein YcdF (DUF218 family)